MSSIEERLTRDIAAVTGGVVVTESDLEDARYAVEERIAFGRQRSRRHTLAAVAAAAVLLPFLGIAAFQTLGGNDEPASPSTSVPTSPTDGPPTGSSAEDAFLIGSAPTPELLAGVWRVDNGTLVVRFSAPNAISLDDSGRLFGDPAIHGTYEIAGDLITVTVEGARAECAGQTFAIRASLPTPGAMRWVPTDESPGSCAPAQYSLWALEQVLPTSAEVAGYDHPSNADWRPVRVAATLHGVWMAQGGGRVLEIDRGGSYFVADESTEVVDRGEWSLRGSELTLTSSGDSGECTEGDRLVWRNLEYTHLTAADAFEGMHHDRRSMLRATVDQSTCTAAWASPAWIMLPQ